MPVLLKVKVTSWTSPFVTSELPSGSTTEALPSPPRTTEPPDGMVILSDLAPLAGFSSAGLSATVTDSSVWSVRPSLNSVAATTAGPPSPGLGCVTTMPFWIFTSPTVVAALSGLICSV